MSDYWHDDANTDDTLSAAIFGTVSALVDEQSGTRERWHRNLRRYLDADVSPVEGTNLGLIDYGAIESRHLSPRGGRSRYNVCRMLLNALISHIALRQPYPQYNTRDASEDVQSVAKSSDRFLRAEMDATRADAKGRRALRLRCIFGTEFTKVWPDRSTKEVESCVYGPDRVVIDNQGANTHQLPPSLFHVDMRDKGELLGMFPGDDDDSKSARRTIDQAPIASSVSGVRRLIQTIEAYMLPGPWGKGRRAIVLPNGTLVDVEYKSKRHQFIAGRYTAPVDGYLGEGLIDEVIGIQAEIDSVFERIAASRRIFGDLYFERDPDSLVVDNDTVAKLGKVLPPGLRVVMPPAFNAQDIEYLEMKKREAFDVTGLNQLAATATKPAGLDSGEALRVYNDTQTKRFSEIENDHAQWRVNYGELVLDAGRELNRAGAYKRHQKATGEILLFGDKDSDRYALHVAPASSLSNEPAGRQAQLESALRNAGITVEQYQRNLGFNEIEKDIELGSASHNLLESIIEDMLTGKTTAETYEAPDHPLDLELTVKLASQYWHRARKNGVDKDRLDLVATLWADARALLEDAPAQPPPAPQDQIANPDVAMATGQAAAMEAALDAGQPVA